MKNLVVYYTRSGNTETVAQEISKMVDGELKKVELKSEIGFGWAAFSSILGLKGNIKEIDFDVMGYDNIFIGGQVWARKSSSPMNALLSKINFTNKNVFVFITQADDKEPCAVFESIVKRVEAKGGNVIDTFFIQTDMKNPLTSEQAKESVFQWINKNNLAKGV